MIYQGNPHFSFQIAACGACEFKSIAVAFSDLVSIKYTGIGKIDHIAVRIFKIVNDIPYNIGKAAANRLCLSGSRRLHGYACFWGNLTFRGNFVGMNSDVPHLKIEGALVAIVHPL